MIEDLRGYRISTPRMQAKGMDPLLLIGIIDSRLTETANYVVICHRCLAEHRANLAWSWFSGRKVLLDKIERASAHLDEALEIQHELIDIRLNILTELARRMSHMDRLLTLLQAKA